MLPSITKALPVSDAHRDGETFTYHDIEKARLDERARIADQVSAGEVLDGIIEAVIGLLPAALRPFAGGLVRRFVGQAMEILSRWLMGLMPTRK